MTFSLVFKEKPISINHMYGQRGKIRFMFKEGKEFKKKLQEACKESYLAPPFEGPVSVKIKYYFVDARPRDVTNYDKPILDSLSKIVYKDDKQIQEIYMKKTIDRDDPRIEIEVEEFDA